LWLAEGIVGDDTDGHIDDLARFVSPRTIVCAWKKIRLMPTTKFSGQSLEAATNDRRARPAFEIATLPMPGVVGGASTDKRNLDRLPASYANFISLTTSCSRPSWSPERRPRPAPLCKTFFPIDEWWNQLRALGMGMGTIHCVNAAAARSMSHGFTLIHARSGSTLRLA